MNSSNDLTARGHRIKSLAIIGGFLDGVQFDFTVGLNCIIGARGTGKTTVVELIRFALDATPRDPQARKKFEALVAGNLNGGRVELKIETKDGLTYTVSRSVGEAPIVLDGKRRPTTLNLAAFFRADIFSQNEVENIADQSQHQLDLIDSFQPDRIAELNQSIDEVSRQIGAVAKQIEPLQVRLVSLRESGKRLPEVEARLEQFAGAVGGNGDAINEAHRRKGQRDREGRAIRAMQNAATDLGRRITELKGVIASENSPLLTWEFFEGENSSIFEALDKKLKTAARSIDGGLEKATAEAESFAASLAEVQAELHEAHDRQELTFRRLVEEQKQHQAQITERTAAERLRNQLLEEKREADDMEKRIAQLEKQSGALVSGLSELRDERYRIRREIAGRLNAELKPTIRIGIRQEGGAEEYRQLLEDALSNSNIKQRVVLEEFRARKLKTDGLEVVIEAPPMLTAKVSRVSVVMAFRNVLKNACEAMLDEHDRFRGCVTVAVRELESSRIEIVVSDTGTGLTPAQLEQVREFLPGKITRKYVGTGFGLPIARRNLRAHGGSIDVESVLHEGTRVTMILPPEPPTEDEL